MSVDVASLSIRVDALELKNADNAMKDMTSTADKLEGMVKKLIGAFALFKAGSFVGDITTLAARYETLGVVMRVVGNNAGYTGSQMDTYAKSLQGAGISMLESRNVLSMMASAQMDLANSTKLGRIAQDAAVIGNINSSEAFKNMVYGIKSGQTEILRTIGINVSFEKSYEKLGLQLKKMPKDLTEVEKVQARTNAVMEQGQNIAGVYAESMGTAGKLAASLTRHWENLQVAMGMTFQPAFAFAIDKITDAAKTMADWIEKNKDLLDDLGGAMKGAVIQGAELTKMLATIGGGAEGASGSISFLTRIIQGVSFLVAGTVDIIKFVIGNALDHFGGLIEKLSNDLKTLTGIEFGGNFGRGLKGRGEELLSGFRIGETSLTKWYDSVLAENDPAKDNSVAEAARIAAASARKAQEALQSTINDAKAMLVTVKNYGVSDRLDSQLDQINTIEMREQMDLVPPATDKLIAKQLELIQSTRNLKNAQLTTWQTIAGVVQDSSRYATGALADWIDDLDGLGHSWESLGDTVRNVISDMLRQMERAIIQQQIMKPAFDWMGLMISGIGSAAAGSAGSSGGSSFDGGASNGGISGTPFGLANRGTSAPIVNVTVNSEGQTSVSGSGTSPAAMKQLGQMIANQTRAILVDESRPGGLLAGRA